MGSRPRLIRESGSLSGAQRFRQTSATCMSGGTSGNCGLRALRKPPPLRFRPRATCTARSSPTCAPRSFRCLIADAISEGGDCKVRTATLQEPEHGLATGVLESTDVLIWWGHAAHGKVSDAIVERVLARVWQGMGFIALHSSHYSKPFMRLMGTSCSIIWREAGEKERLWVCNPAHPIARGIDRYFEIENVEMYGEPFAVPTHDEIAFISWLVGGAVVRSGFTWKHGHGKIF